MSVPAVYVSKSGTSTAVNVRLHKSLSRGEAGDGAGSGWAETLDIEPRIKFDRNEVADPSWGALVIFSESEAYRVDSAHPPEGGFVYSNVSQLKESEAQGHWKAEYADLL
jgi:hypothetical protein